MLGRQISAEGAVSSSPDWISCSFLLQSLLLQAIMKHISQFAESPCHTTTVHFREQLSSQVQGALCWILSHNILPFSSACRARTMIDASNHMGLPPPAKVHLSSSSMSQAGTGCKSLQQRLLKARHIRVRSATIQSQPASKCFLPDPVPYVPAWHMLHAEAPAGTPGVR